MIRSTTPLVFNGSSRTNTLWLCLVRDECARLLAARAYRGDPPAGIDAKTSGGESEE